MLCNCRHCTLNRRRIWAANCVCLTYSRGSWEKVFTDWERRTSMCFRSVALSCLQLWQPCWLYVTKWDSVIPSDMNRHSTTASYWRDFVVWFHNKCVRPLERDCIPHTWASKALRRGRDNASTGIGREYLQTWLTNPVATHATPVPSHNQKSPWSTILYRATRGRRLAVNAFSGQDYLCTVNYLSDYWSRQPQGL